MKKAIIAIVVIALAAAAAVGIYFAVGNNNSNEPATELLVTKDSIGERISLLEALIKNPDRYKTHLAEKYGLGSEKAEEFYAAPENWLTFEQIIVIENVGDKNYTVYGFISTHPQAAKSALLPEAPPQQASAFSAQTLSFQAMK